MSRKQETIGPLEILDGQPEVDPITSDKDFMEVIADEAFMNELVEVIVHTTTNESEPNHVVLNVNGINQPVLRGYPHKIKRKYLEVLARMKETRYSQVTPNPMEPDRSNLVARTALCYPFDVIKDPNPRGRAWLNHILAEPA